MRCTWCDAPAIVDQPYRGAHVCSAHLKRSVEDRFRGSLRRQLPADRRGTVAVALSGGKDSAVTLALLAERFRDRPDTRLVAISVDEGIREYRPRALEAARALTHQLGVEHRVVRTQEVLGASTDGVARADPDVPPCTACGVWRRTLLNREARAVGADALVLGFNLDDLAQTVLMNLVQGDIDRLLRMAPHASPRPGLVPRIAPLAEVPEREVFLYAVETGLPFDHAECPHAGRALRNRFRELVWTLEDARPGSRQSLMRTRERLVAAIRPGAFPDEALTSCRECGEASSGPVCRACAILARAGGGPVRGAVA